MKRNMDLVRDILLSVEATPVASAWVSGNLYKESKYPPREIMAHYEILKKAGFLNKDGIPYLTWSGYQLLDLIRNNESAKGEISNTDSEPQGEG